MNKHCKNCKKLHREHLIGCWGVNLFLLKDVTIITVTTFTTDTITTVTIWLFKFCHIFFCSFVAIWVFEFYNNLIVLILSQFEYLNFVTPWVFEFSHNLIFLSFVTNWVFEFLRSLALTVLEWFKSDMWEVSVLIIDIILLLLGGKI